jgi:flagellar biosynthesis/type III secretory pathway protein FliH
MAGLILKGQEREIEWLERSYPMIDEKFGASPMYQRTIEKGIAIGEERGKAEGIALGKSQTLAQLRKRVMEIVITRFASLIHLAKEVVAAINDVDALLDLLVTLGQAQSSFCSMPW